VFQFGTVWVVYECKKRYFLIQNRVKSSKKQSFLGKKRLKNAVFEAKMGVKSG